MFDEVSAQPKSLDVGSDSIRQNLETKRQRLAKQLKDTDDALKAMDNNPDAAKLIELVLKAGRY